MHIVIVYDSIFGNTGQVARAMADALGSNHDVTLNTVHEARDLNLAGTDLLIVGSPTRGFHPTPQIAEFVAGLADTPPGVTGAAFDTRIDLETVNPSPLRWVVDAGGYAATRIADALRHHHIALAGEPGGFIVTGQQGPLKQGELERAAQWARALVTP